ncbi:zinc transporter ZIP9 isoform X3 [Mus musculus]|nr:zinc transporter ZIP9 isoform X3 [Mus musculus]|eukprot:XP_006516096.1 PREDICTED: zinc transporter ZIP9 isoform X3 [Mus musculus]
MDDFLSISLLSVAMLVGCYVAGIIPLAVNFSEERLKLVTVLGAGLLCGTALAVIVPEGVHALYEEVLEGKHHQTSEMKQNGIASDKAAEISSVHEHEHSHDHTQLHAYIGVSLVLGFVFMLLVDQIGSSHVHSSDDPETARPSSSKITTTLGLVVHAAGSSSIWAGFLPDACWSGAESNQKALAGLCIGSTSHVHADILRIK